MFLMDNTEGFTQDELDLMNEALKVLEAEGLCVDYDGDYDDSHASCIINNNWMATGNTVETLAAH